MSLNPFNFGRKYNAAWNALMAWYTFHQIPDEQKLQAIETMLTIESSIVGRAVTLDDLARSMTVEQVFYFMSLALGHLGIRPALGDEGWFEVKEPRKDTDGFEAVLGSTRDSLEKEHGVRIKYPFDLSSIANCYQNSSSDIQDDTSQEEVVRGDTKVGDAEEEPVNPSGTRLPDPDKNIHASAARWAISHIEKHFGSLDDLPDELANLVVNACYFNCVAELVQGECIDIFYLPEPGSVAYRMMQKRGEIAS